jgi:hypothetical protein
MRFMARLNSLRKNAEGIEYPPRDLPQGLKPDIDFAVLAARDPHTVWVPARALIQNASSMQFFSKL